LASFSPECIHQGFVKTVSAATGQDLSKAGFWLKDSKQAQALFAVLTALTLRTMLTVPFSLRFGGGQKLQPSLSGYRSSLLRLVCPLHINPLF
jgi:hypothetical protein